MFQPNEIIWIANTRARGCSNGHRKIELEGIIGSTGAVYFPESIAALRARLSIVINRGWDIGVIGGDGTDHICLEETIKLCQRMHKRKPRFVFTHKGTKHVLADYFNPKQRLEETMGFMTSAVETRGYVPSKKARPLKITTEQGIQYGFMFATGGCLANFFEEYYGHGAPNWATEKLLIAKGAGSFLLQRIGLNGKFIDRITAPLDANLKLRIGKFYCETSTRPYNFIAACPLNVSISGLKPFCASQPRTYVGKPFDEFHVLAGNVPAAKALGAMPELLLGIPTGIVPLIDVPSNFLGIEYKEQQKYILDGDEYKAASICAELGPEVEIYSIR